jgi:hypothetical protein
VTRLNELAGLFRLEPGQKICNFYYFHLVYLYILVH